MADGLNFTQREQKEKVPTPDELRTQTLRDMLKFELKEDDLIPAVRELARLMLVMYDNLATLPEIKRTMAQTQSMVIRFVEDTLKERRDREARELEIHNMAIAKAREKLNQTDEKIKRMQFPIRYEKPEPPQLEATPAEKTWVWFRDKVLPYFATGAAVIILQAIWEYLRLRVNTP